MHGVSDKENFVHILVNPPLHVRCALWYSCACLTGVRGCVRAGQQFPSDAEILLELFLSRPAVQPLDEVRHTYPFEAGCLPLMHSGKPGVTRRF